MNLEGDSIQPSSRWKKYLEVFCDNTWKYFSRRSQVSHILDSDCEVERGHGLEVVMFSECKFLGQVDLKI